MTMMDLHTHTHTHTCRLFASCGNRKLYLYWLRFLSNTHSRHFQMVKGSFFWATHDLNLLFSPFFLCRLIFVSFCRFIVDEQTGRLTINDAKRTDEGEIKCLVENRAGKIQKTAYLKVNIRKNNNVKPFFLLDL